jgi:hypothetical protein
VDGVKAQSGPSFRRLRACTDGRIASSRAHRTQHRLRLGRLCHGLRWWLTRRAAREIAPFVYAGAATLILVFFAVPEGPSSMWPLFGRSPQAGRLFGVPLEGVWMHVGTPEAIKAAKAAILATNECSKVLIRLRSLCGEVGISSAHTVTKSRHRSRPSST